MRYGLVSSGGRGGKAWEDSSDSSISSDSDHAYGSRQQRQKQKQKQRQRQRQRQSVHQNNNINTQSKPHEACATAASAATLAEPRRPKAEQQPLPSGAIRLTTRDFPLPASPASFVLSTSSSGGGGAVTVASAAANAKGDRYRESAERAHAKIAPVSSEKIDGARADACRSYALPIQVEFRKTQEALAALALDMPSPASSSAAAAASAAPAVVVDAAVAETLRRVQQLHDDFERRLREEAEAEQRKKDEEKRKEDEEKRKEEEAVREATEKAKRDAAEKKQKEEAAEKARRDKAQRSKDDAAEKAKSDAAEKSRLASGVSAEALAWADRYRAMYQQLMGGAGAQVKADRAVKAYCFKQRGLVTRSIGQLKDSVAFVTRVAATVGDVLAEASRLHGAVAHQWMLNLTAKALVKQAEREVAVAHHAAYPLAAAAVQLMRRFPDLGDLLLVRLVKKCPYVVPQYGARQPGQGAEEFLRSIGYKERDDGALESEGIYNERMAGMLALFAAVVQTPPEPGKPSVLPVAMAWTWLARMLNMPPRTISPLLVHVFLSVAGAALAAAYGRHFACAIDVLATEWIPAISSTDAVAVAAKSNLQGFVDAYRQTGVLNECPGRVIKRD